ncbi:MAG: glycoside hydrolase 15-related protein [Gemmatimonadetes bacterium]|nr:glycoside hydrolase 15-related protein [Gemmatimonadota bacterium]
MVDWAGAGGEARMQPRRDDGGYPPIADHGFVGNLRTAALVAMDGTVDWCCLPDLGSPSVFASLLDARRGGCFRVAPAGWTHSGQRYIDSTNVLQTVFRAPGGTLSVTDFMPLHGDISGKVEVDTRPELVRLLRCAEGSVRVEVEWSPRLDYARARMEMEADGDAWRARGGADAVTLAGLPAGARVERSGHGPVLRAEVELSAGQELALVTAWGERAVEGDEARCGRELRATLEAWDGWVDGLRGQENPFGGEWHPQVVRSGLALKLLTHAHTGAIAAAPTTSLPEEIGGVRNWDYRYGWIRDSSFAAQALLALGCREEAMDFVDWVHRVSRRAATPGGLQIMYGLHGETELPEIELPHLEGYRGSRPVRIGNGAAKQHQLDVHGELISSAYELIRMGGTMDPEVMEFLAAVADDACRRWEEPDSGIWEIRAGPRQFVYSKVMAWVALDRAVRLAERHGLRGDVDYWRHNRALLRAAIEEKGYDARVGAFVQSFGSTALDAANLLLPVVEFLPFGDPRVQGTIDATLRDLTVDGLVYRYRREDGIAGGEGTFGLCTFWMVHALALSGRTAEAREIFTEMAARCNHLGLYSEEVDPRTGGFLGNFPQAFTHIGFINAALYLARAEGRTPSVPAPVGTRQHARETGHRADAAE